MPRARYVAAGIHTKTHESAVHTPLPAAGPRLVAQSYLPAPGSPAVAGCRLPWESTLVLPVVPGSSGSLSADATRLCFPSASGCIPQPSFDQKEMLLLPSLRIHERCELLWRRSNGRICALANRKL